MSNSSFGDANELTADELAGARLARSQIAPAAVERPPAPPVEELAPAPGGSGDEPGSLSRRFLRPQTLVSFLLAIAILVFFVRGMHIDVHAVWQNVRRANLGIYALAFVAFYSGFILRARRWRQMLARVDIDEEHGCNVPSDRGIVEIFLLSWFANCIVPAKLGDAYRSYLMKRESGSSFSSGLGTIVAERLMDLLVLFLAMSALGIAVFTDRWRKLSGHEHRQVEQAFVLGLALLVLAAVVLTAMWFSRHLIERKLPLRVREQYARLHDGVFACLRRPWPFLATSIGIWVLEGVRLYLVTLALGANVSFETASFVALMSSLLTTLPITPAGLGVVEVAMTAVFTMTGVNRSMALSLALMDRLIGYWSIVAVGIILYVRRFRKEVG